MAFILLSGAISCLNATFGIGKFPICVFSPKLFKEKQYIYSKKHL